MISKKKTTNGKPIKISLPQSKVPARESGNNDNHRTLPQFDQEVAFKEIMDAIGRLTVAVEEMNKRIPPKQDITWLQKFK